LIRLQEEVKYCWRASVELAPAYSFLKSSEGDDDDDQKRATTQDFFFWRERPFFDDK